MDFYIGAWYAYLQRNKKYQSNGSKVKNVLKMEKTEEI